MNLGLTRDYALSSYLRILMLTCFNCMPSQLGSLNENDSKHVRTDYLVRTDYFFYIFNFLSH